MMGYPIDAVAAGDVVKGRRAHDKPKKLIKQLELCQNLLPTCVEVSMAYQTAGPKKQRDLLSS